MQTQDKVKKRRIKNARPDNISYEDSIYYTKDEVKNLMEYSSDTAAYQLIQKLNRELEAQGYIVRKGLVPKSYFHKRVYAK